MKLQLNYLICVISDAGSTATIPEEPIDLLGGAQPVIPPNLYSYTFMNIIAWCPQVTNTIDVTEITSPFTLGIFCHTLQTCRAGLLVLLIRSPKFSRDFGFYGFAAEQNGFTYTLIPTLTLTITPKLSITLTTTLTLTRARNNRIRV